jgi:hypothetical protein
MGTLQTLPTLHATQSTDPYTKYLVLVVRIGKKGRAFCAYRYRNMVKQSGPNHLNQHAPRAEVIAGRQLQ